MSEIAETVTANKGMDGNLLKEIKFKVE